jgi:hypothetical protein
MPRSKTPIRKRKKIKKEFNYDNLLFYFFIIILFWIYYCFFNPNFSLISLL